MLESVLSAALASIASQGFELLIGAKDKFFWKNVALGALGGVINAGLPTDFAKGLGKWGQLAAKAALSNALTQGIAVTTGLQPKFDWKAVATSAIAAPLGQALGDSLLGTQYDSQGKVSGHEDTSFTRFLSPMGAQFTQAVADVLVGTVRQGIRMAVYGKGKLDFASIAADAFGSALGNSVMSQVNHYQQAKAQAAMSEPGSGFGLRATPKNWAAFNEGLTNTINANQKARQGTAPEGNPGLSPEAIRAAAALQAAYEGYGKPTGERTFITGRDVNNVSEAFYKTHRRAPTPTEAIALGNYNRLSDAHSVGRNRVLAVPNDLSVLDAYGANEEQLAAYNAAAKRFDALKEQRANAALSDMFRTYKDGKLYVSPQNGGLYDAIFNEGQKGIVEYERAMSQPSPTYGKWPEPKPDFIDNVLATGKAIGYEILQTGPRVYDLGQITAGYVSLRFFDKDLDVKLISDIGRATQSGNFSTEGREFKVGFSLYAGLGGGAELTFIPDSNSFFGIKVKEFDADLGVGLGVKFGSRWQPKTMMGPNTPQGEFGYATTLPRMEGIGLIRNVLSRMRARLVLG